MHSKSKTYAQCYHGRESEQKMAKCCYTTAEEENGIVLLVLAHIHTVTHLFASYEPIYNGIGSAAGARIGEVHNVRSFDQQINRPFDTFRLNGVIGADPNGCVLR